MTRHSLRFRLLSAALLVTLGALVLAGFSLVELFAAHLERRVEAELETYLDQLIDRLEVRDDDRIHLTHGLVDARFEQPLSGLYWQVQDDNRPTLLRSRSLWDSMIGLPKDELSVGDVHQHALTGPSGEQLMVRERQVILNPTTAPRRLRIAVAYDRRELDAAGHAFTADMLPYFGALATFLILASWIQVRTGLRPLEQVRRGVTLIRSGESRRLAGNYPDEVMPLIHEIDKLLEARDAMVEKARAWTGDLAHGLKTPLSALGANAQSLRESGQPEFADELDRLAQTMRRRVDRELIRARLRSAGPSMPCRTDLVEISNRVLNTFQRTSGRELLWISDLPEKAVVSIREEDLTELLGNLLDNAAKWAQRVVRISLDSSNSESVDLMIEDDGPGVPEVKRQQLGQRGVRLDQTMHGYGIGLAIVRDIMDAYGTSMAFAESPLGGLAVRVKLPISGATQP